MDIMININGLKITSKFTNKNQPNYIIFHVTDYLYFNRLDDININVDFVNKIKLFVNRDAYKCGVCLEDFDIMLNNGENCTKCLKQICIKYYKQLIEHICPFCRAPYICKFESGQEDIIIPPGLTDEEREDFIKFAREQIEKIFDVNVTSVITK
jgi:hypothetical protein